MIHFFQGASCGYGVRRRVVECIRFDHLKVDKSHCLTVNVTFTVNSWTDPAWLAASQEESVSSIYQVFERRSQISLTSKREFFKHHSRKAFYSIKSLLFINFVIFFPPMPYNF